jgi:hypothetical protein
MDRSKGMMTDLATTPAEGLQTTPQQIARVLVKWVRQLFALGPVRGSSYPAAWELAGITCIDRFEIAPWVFF